MGNKFLKISTGISCSDCFEPSELLFLHVLFTIKNFPGADKLLQPLYYKAVLIQQKEAGSEHSLTTILPVRGIPG